MENEQYLRPAARRAADKASLNLLLLAGVLLAAGAARADWPQFRGPTGDGHAAPAGTPVGLPLHWSETENVKWKTPIPGRGYSTPAILDGQIWLTTATPDGHDFFVLCIDAAKGDIVYNEKVFHCDHPEPLGNSVNTYATPSAALEPGRVYVHFGSYGTAGIDTAAKTVLWQRQDLPCRHYRGPASSVVLFENFVILTMDGVDVQYLVALDKKTGQTVWKTNRSVEWHDMDIQDSMTREGDRRKAHSTPLIVQVNGQPQMLTVGAMAAYAYDPRTGKELWRVRHEAWSASAMPVYDQGLAFLDTGFGGPTELWAVHTDGQGDVTDTKIAWKCTRGVPRTASPIVVDHLLYMVSDEGALTALEPATGAIVWREHLEGSYAASPIFADGRLYFFNQQGKATVVKPGRTFEALADNRLETGLMASPAVDGKALILRTKTHLYRIEDGAAAR